MDKLRIRGGRRLEGEVTISGAKNAALPELCAALLTPEPVTLRNLPRLHDVATMQKLLRNMGVQVEPGGAAEPDSVTLDAREVAAPEAPYDLVKTMRASILVLGPLLARFGRARVSLPGGCAIGSRPVDQHIKGLQAMGAQIAVEHGYIVASAPNGLKGARIVTDMVTVTGTENLLMAATLADGETWLDNAAQEPEIPDLAEMLIAMGAMIEGHGTSRIRVQGVDRLHGLAGDAAHRIVPDRIEAGTFLCAVAAAGGSVVLRRARADHLDVVIDKLREAGVAIEAGPDWIRVGSTGRSRAVGFRTSEYPGFPDRHAGPVHDAGLPGRRRFGHHRNHLREPLHARQRTGPTGCQDRDRRPHRDRAGRGAVVGRDRDGDRPARLGQPGHRRAGGGRGDHHRTHLPPGPRLRPDGGQAARHRCRYRTREVMMDPDVGPMITLALSKGRIFDETLPLLEAAGVRVTEDPERSRKLILPTSRPGLRLVLVRASDVPTYVQYGGADLGIVGRDTLIEHGGEGLYQPLDLKISTCRISVAVRSDFDYAAAVKQGSRLRVATKYTRIARDHFADKGVHVDLIKLYGSMELAPLTGLADAIVDLVSTGSTLRANQLVEVERIMDISARMIVNPAALKLKREAMRGLLDAFAQAVAA